MKMPVIFSGHGSPMVAIENNEITQTMNAIGDSIEKPKAILAISAHWYTDHTSIQSVAHPKQIYDMYGFPKELYELQYPVSGSAPLTESVRSLLGTEVTIDDTWGIDHGTWSVLVHMFPKADIPVVQLSVNRHLDPQQSYALGQKLEPLRDQGYLIFGSGNVVHNLGRVEWDNPDGTEMTHRFNDAITYAVESHDHASIIHYDILPDAAYAVPTPDHFLPLLYCLGAAGNDPVTVFNNVCNLGSMAMTGYVFGKK